MWLGNEVFDGWHWQNVEKSWATTDGIMEAAYVHEVRQSRKNSPQITFSRSHAETRSIAVTTAITMISTAEVDA